MSAPFGGFSRGRPGTAQHRAPPAPPCLPHGRRRHEPSGHPAQQDSRSRAAPAQPGSVPPLPASPLSRPGSPGTQGNSAFAITAGGAVRSRCIQESPAAGISCSQRLSDLVTGLEPAGEEQAVRLLGAARPSRDESCSKHRQPFVVETAFLVCPSQGAGTSWCLPDRQYAPAGGLLHTHPGGKSLMGHSQRGRC